MICLSFFNRELFSKHLAVLEITIVVVSQRVHSKDQSYIEENSLQQNL